MAPESTGGSWIFAGARNPPGYALAADPKRPATSEHSEEA
jgi:hypothetical protein